MQIDQDVKRLGGGPLFQHVPPEEARAFIERAALRSYAAGRTIYSQDEVGNTFYMVAKGLVTLHHATAQGQMRLVQHLTSGDLLGFGPALHRWPRQTAAIAQHPAQLLMWEARDLLDVPTTFPHVLRAALLDQSQLLVGMWHYSLELKNLSVDQRLARVLLHLHSRMGRAIENGVLIDIPLTRSDLADLTDATIFTVSRIMAQWEKNGIVGGGRSQVVVRDAAALHQLGAPHVLANTPPAAAARGRLRPGS